MIAADVERSDLVVSDIVMPQMAGRALAARLALDMPDVPILLMSGYDEDEFSQGPDLPASTTGQGVCP